MDRELNGLEEDVVKEINENIKLWKGYFDLNDAIALQKIVTGLTNLCIFQRTDIDELTRRVNDLECKLEEAERKLENWN